MGKQKPKYKTGDVFYWQLWLREHGKEPEFLIDGIKIIDKWYPDYSNDGFYVLQVASKIFETCVADHVERSREYTYLGNIQQYPQPEDRAHEI